MKTVEQVKAELQAKAKELALKHGKPALHDVNQELLPLAIDLVCAYIPGEIDNTVAAIGTPILVKALDEVINDIGAEATV